MCRAVLFVCLGNICRSPTAEGVMRALVRDAGLEDEIELDSAGTGGWHVGEPPDARATRRGARARGRAARARARQVRARGLRRVRSDCSRWTARTSPTCGARARRRARARRSGCCASSTRQRRRASSTCRTPTTAAAWLRATCSTIVQAACAGLLAQIRARRRRRREAARRARATRERVGGGDINEAWRVVLADGREAFVKTRAGRRAG